MPKWANRYFVAYVTDGEAFLYPMEYDILNDPEPDMHTIRVPISMVPDARKGDEVRLGDGGVFEKIPAEASFHSGSSEHARRTQKRQHPHTIEHDKEEPFTKDPYADPILPEPSHKVKDYWDHPIYKGDPYLPRNYYGPPPPPRWM